MRFIKDVPLNSDAVDIPELPDAGIELPDDTGEWQDRIEMPDDSGDWVDTIELTDNYDNSTNSINLQGGLDNAGKLERESISQDNCEADDLICKEKQDIADEVARQYNEKFQPFERAQQKGYTDVVRTENGGVSFEKSKALYVTEDGISGTVVIEATGSRTKDFSTANAAIGLEDTPEGYVWHHVDDYDVESNTLTLQLVKDEAHNAAKPHSGACAQYDAVHGPSYNPPRKDVSNV